MDRRTIKTKRSIKNAFVDLLATTPYENITIKEISESAEITRKTFYYYYNGIYELVEDIKDDVAILLESILDNIDFTNDIHAPKVIMQKIYNGVNENESTKKLFALPGNHNFLYNFIFNIIVEKLKDKLSKVFYVDDDVKLRIIVNYLVNGLLSSYRYYYSNRSKISSYQYTSTIETLTFGAIEPFIKK